MALNYENIPEQLRWDNNWCLAGPDDLGSYKAPYALGNKGIFKCKSTVSTHWKDLETIIEQVETNPPCGLGFCLSRTAGFSVIDLDVKNEINYPDKIDNQGRPIEWTTPEQLARFEKIITTFNSYTERSASGQGFHIWVKGSIGEGLKRDGVEIYSQSRFIVCTGDVYLDRDIEQRQELLEILHDEIMQGHNKQSKFELIEIEQTEDDAIIWQRAKEADNYEKFQQLCEGDFYGYPSQSEADLALMSIFAFYTKSNEQCRRMFRQTKLGQRPKATKNNKHVDYCLVLIRSREEEDARIDEIVRVNTNALLAKYSPAALAAKAQLDAQAELQAAIKSASSQNETLQVIAKSNIFLTPEEIIEALPFTDTPLQKIPDEDTAAITWPPGKAGELAHYFYRYAPRPVKEVCIVAALGFLAGVAGKAWYVPQSGLNLYIVLIARSAIGKEAMHSSISNLVSFIAEQIPEIHQFVDFQDYSSGPALTKAVLEKHSFVNVSGEWGRKLKRLAIESQQDGPLQTLRTAMTNLYQKSGPRSSIGGISYSDKEKNVGTANGVAYSMIGETTPGTFYESLTTSMMEDGFLSRFTMIEYSGERPELNSIDFERPNEPFMQHLYHFVDTAIANNTTEGPLGVQFSYEADQLLTEFNTECDLKVRGETDESQRQMWNRAHLKALRIAAILSVFEMDTKPFIYYAHAKWAIDLIRRDIVLFQKRMAAGDIGGDDAAREKKVLTLLFNYLKSDTIPSSYGILPAMKIDKVVPRKYLQILTQKINSFTSHRLGQNMILDSTLRSLMDSGYISEIPKSKAAEIYNFTGRCFRILNLPKP